MLDFFSKRCWRLACWRRNLPDPVFLNRLAAVLLVFKKAAPKKSQDKEEKSSDKEAAGTESPVPAADEQ